MPKIALPAVLLALLLGACTQMRESNPSRTATEQLLLSAAADRAAERLANDIPAGSRIFLDAANFDAYDGKYAVSTIRSSLMKHGAFLVADRGQADTIVEVRAGALSTDSEKLLIGIPSFDVPIPLAGDLKSPEIALFKRDRTQGVAKFAATGYDAKTGSLVATTDPVFGLSQKTEYVALLFFSWARNDVKPPAEGTLLDRAVP